MKNLTLQNNHKAQLDMIQNYELLFLTSCDDDLYNDLRQTFESLTNNILTNKEAQNSTVVSVENNTYKVAIKRLLIDTENQAIEITLIVTQH